MDQSTSHRPIVTPEWGPFVPGEAVASVAELTAGDLVLERTKKPGFGRACHFVVEILGGDPTGGNRPMVQARLVEPTNPQESLPNTPGWFVLWDFCLNDGRTEIFRAVRG